MYVNEMEEVEDSYLCEVVNNRIAGGKAYMRDARDGSLRSLWLVICGYLLRIRDRLPHIDCSLVICYCSKSIRCSEVKIFSDYLTW
jgi:hypothetical protein